MSINESLNARMLVPFGLGCMLGRFSILADISMKSMGGGTIFCLFAAPNVGASRRVSRRCSVGAEDMWCSPCWGTHVGSNDCSLTSNY